MKTYGLTHVPLIATVKQNIKNPSKSVGFIGNVLCYFENDSEVPDVGSSTEVMVTRILFGKKKSPTSEEFITDYTKVKAVMIRVVDLEKHLLVAIDGFEKTIAPGHSKAVRTSSHGFVSKEGRAYSSDEVFPKFTINFDETEKQQASDILQRMWLVPGYTGIKSANNQDPTIQFPLTPTNVYVLKSEHIEKSGNGIRVEGLTRLEDGQWYSYLNKYNAVTHTDKNDYNKKQVHPKKSIGSFGELLLAEMSKK